MAKFNVGDKVLILEDENFISTKYQNTVGRYGTICKVPDKNWSVPKYAVLIEGMHNNDSKGGFFYFFEKDMRFVGNTKTKGVISFSNSSKRYFTVHFTSEKTKGGREQKYMVVQAVSPHGEATVKCEAEKASYYTGCLVAAAKMTSIAGGALRVMYNMAIEDWGSSFSTLTLRSLADYAMDGNFSKVYAKLVNDINNEIDKKNHICPICGKKFELTVERDKCIARHEENKKKKAKKYEDYMIRREAKKKLEQMKHNNLVNEVIMQMLREEEENNGNETE